MSSHLPVIGTACKRARILFGTALLVNVGSAWCSNLNFLDNTPISYMTQAEINSLQKAALNTLNSKSDGESMHWTNHGSGNSVAVDATLTPDQTETSGAKTCRYVRVLLNAKGQSMNLHPRYCRIGGAQWQLQKKN